MPSPPLDTHDFPAGKAGVDLRVFFVGDSFVAGVGDPEHRGWVGRLAARTHQAGRPLTAYNLGVRRNTSTDVSARWTAEIAARRSPDTDERLLVSFGANDTALENGRRRVSEDDSVANLRKLITAATRAALPLLVVGPPAVDDAEQNTRLRMLDRAFQRLTASLAIPFVDVHDRLVESPLWMDEVGAGDGAHPAARGYQLLADLVFPRWWSWLMAG